MILGWIMFAAFFAAMFAFIARDVGFKVAAGIFAVSVVGTAFLVTAAMLIAS